MKSYLLLTPVLITLFLTGCKTGPAKSTFKGDYDFRSPDASVVLPAVLQEVSGITLTDSNMLACIQDENGILFLYDLAKNKISRQLEFFSNGDYEGIARVMDTIYVLRSDGMLIEIAGFRSDNAIVTPFTTDIPSKDNEGLCYDSENGRLLIACKESTGKGDLSKDKRYVFGFDLKSKSLIEEPVFSFDIQALKEFAINNGISLPMKGKKKGPQEPVLRFQTSGIAIHPLTHKLYLLSSEDFLLSVFDRNGNIDNMVRLNMGLFNQPEGITFMENGDLLVSNEGQGKGPATLRRFSFNPE
jgi:uncharacterized protein YjiK